MTYIIRANPGPGYEKEPPTFLMPTHDGGYRRGSMDEAIERGFDSRDQAVEFMKDNGLPPDHPAHTIIEVDVDDGE